LDAEQRAFGELNDIVLTRLLDPLQTAHSVIATFPTHCDVLSLLNAVQHVCAA